MELQIDELGSESISFSWTVSLKPPPSIQSPNRCVEFVNDFTLKARDLSNNLTQNCTIGKESFLYDGQYIRSDTSSCDNISILACSNYSLEIVPNILDDSFPSLEQSSVTASTVPG